MDILCASWNEWIKASRCRNLEPRGQPIPLGGGRFLVCKIQVLRLYANPEAAKILCLELLKHMNYIRNAIKEIKKAKELNEGKAEDDPTRYVAKIVAPPRRFAPEGHKYPPIKFPAGVILPLKECHFILTIPAGASGPIDANGMLQGTVHTEIKHFLHQKPLLVTIAAMDACSDDCVELDAVPAPPVYPSVDEVRHPLLKQLMLEEPDKTLAQHVRSIATLDPKLLARFAPHLLPTPQPSEVSPAAAAAAAAAQIEGGSHDAMVVE
jgi:hypothetical protein